jgi:acetyl-CoA acetyltransferase
MRRVAVVGVGPRPYITAGMGISASKVTGATFPAVYATVARRHMFQHDTTREHIAAVAVKNARRNSPTNPCVFSASRGENIGGEGVPDGRLAACGNF